LAELKKSNSELEAEISKERELEKKQQEFFSAASHELKTPLTILKGHLMGMLNKVKGYENQESYMERSLAVVEKMETLVKELLYVSKTDGKQRTEYKTIDFAELLRVQIADVTDLLSEKEISLSVDIPDKILCDADPAQMERAIQNVLVNAIRYSPNGEAIYISLSNDKNTVSCKVENTGVHIPEEMIPHLFEAFYRADTSRNRNTGGTGLGLYIVRKIMELHHAKYGIQNTSRGVVFWLEMPQERGAINSI
jgi:two-component system sensor histidine kinase VanS